VKSAAIIHASVAPPANGATLHFKLTALVPTDANIPAPTLDAQVEIMSLDIGIDGGPVRLALVRTPKVVPVDALALAIGGGGFTKIDGITFNPGKPFTIELTVTQKDGASSPIKLIGMGGASGTYDTSATTNTSSNWTAAAGATAYDEGVKTEADLDDVAVWVTTQ
jgi:hypothetical protein